MHKAKTLPIGLVNAILDDAGLSADELRELK